MEEDGDEDIALKVYLLQLLSYSIFTNKTSNRADAKLLLLLSDLRRAGEWAWGVGALVNLYTELTYSSLKTTKNLAGFPALLQAWIMWYFPRVWKRKVAVAGSTALGGQWTKRKTNQTVVECRRMVDQLTTDDVCWQPFQGQENAREYEFLSLFRGWLKWGDMTVPYMPDRCFRQFGYVQSIPHCPLRAPYPSHRDIMRSIAEFMNVVAPLVASARVATYFSEVADGYLQWYANNSYPRLMGDLEEAHEDDVGAGEEQQQGGQQHQPPHWDEPQQHQPPHWDEPAPTDGAPVPQHHPQWVHQLVEAVREGLASGDIVPRTRTWGRTYAIVGTSPEPRPQAQTRRGRGPRRQ